MAISLEVNGRVRQADVDSDTPLLWALRNALGVLGPKFGCGVGLCGACTVHVDGRPTRSCITPTAAVEGSKITTIEGLDADPLGRKVQQAWLDLDVAQCGYCQPGQIMSAVALLAATPQPSDAEVDAAMAGNICRCATYNRIRAAIRCAAGRKGG